MRSGKRGCGGGSPNLPSVLLPAVASRLKVAYTAATIRDRVHESKAPGRAPADGAAGLALGRAGVWGQHPKLLSNVGVRTSEHRFFGSAERSTG